MVSINIRFLKLAVIAEFCSRWKSATQFSLQQYKAGLPARGKSSHHDNNPLPMQEGKMI
jgi:hypothetical protein